MSNLTYVLPESSRLQCPLCNAPIKEARIAKAPTGDKGVLFDCCGNLVTLACLRDSFGIDLSA